MTIDEVFPWNTKTLEKIRELFLTEEELEIKWYWHSFHRTGFSALKFAASKSMTNAEFETRIKNLSCPAVPRWLKSPKYFSLYQDFRKSGVVDDHERIYPLDPEVSITHTYELSGQQIEPFRAGVLLTIAELKNILGESLSSKWTPSFSDRREITELFKLYTGPRSILEKIYTVSGWEQIEGLEPIIGLTRSLSNLHFTRIYS